MDSHRLSAGCRSCQQGRWVCIFLTYLCNASCSFCPSPVRGRDLINSALGSMPEQILDRMEGRDFNAVAFSGGDCMLVYDRLAGWLRQFKRRRPDVYYWTYTNGLAATPERLARLADLGLDEIRYNIAATGYDSERMVEQIGKAVRLFPRVAVEIPSMPGDYAKVMRVLPKLNDAGVAFLNLHERIYPRGRAGRQGCFLLNMEEPIRYDPFSLANTARIARFCKRHRMGIRVNNCSLEKKENQMRKRRLAMAKIFRKAHEQLTPEGLLVTRLLFPGRISCSRAAEIVRTPEGFRQIEHCLVHPSRVPKNFRGTSMLLRFLPPMSWDGQRRLLKSELHER